MALEQGQSILAAPASLGTELWQHLQQQELGPERGEIFSLNIILWPLKPPEGGSFLLGWRIQGLDRTFLCQQHFLSLTQWEFLSLFIVLLILLASFWVQPPWQLPLSAPPAFSSSRANT